jgi:hypothetical protein
MADELDLRSRAERYVRRAWEINRLLSSVAVTGTIEGRPVRVFWEVAWTYDKAGAPSGYRLYDMRMFFIDTAEGQHEQAA